MSRTIRSYGQVQTAAIYMRTGTPRDQGSAKDRGSLLSSEGKINGTLMMVHYIPSPSTHVPPTADL